MRYEILEGAYPVLVCGLDEGESVITQSAAMAWMTPDFELEVTGESVGRALGRAITGASLFRNIYTALSDGSKIALQSDEPGKIFELDIAPEKDFILQKTAFLASEMSVDLSVYVTEKLSAGIFGGEGIFLQRLSGEGKAFGAVYGDMVEYELGENERMIVDTGNVIGFEDTVSMTIESVPGLKNKLFSGQGLFNTVLTGPGRIMLRTKRKHSGLHVSSSSSSSTSTSSSETSTGTNG